MTDGLHLSRTALAGIVAALVVALVGGLALHVRQLRAAQSDVRALQAQAALQRSQLGDVDRQADALARQLHDLQQENAVIRRMLGIHGRPGAERGGSASAPHAADSTPPTFAGVRGRLKRLWSVSTATHIDVARLDRLTHRVLDLRRLARIAHDRLIAALPSLNPVGGGIASGFGWRASPWPEFHSGLDLAADFGSPVHAAADATVVSAGWDGGFGNKVDLDHTNGYHTWYAHLSSFAVHAGERVRKGQIIAFVGATGEATGPHLHYQVMRDGRPIDPEPFLNGVPRAVLATLPLSPRVQ